MYRIATHCGQWGVFRGQEATPIFIGSIWSCIAYRADAQEMARC